MRGMLLLASILLAMATAALAQLLSPGKLAQAHAKLEGVSNCTQCHTAGKQITASRCLDCHEDLAARLREQAGYHARVQGDCIDCHSDHRGLDYKMIRWQPQSFDHDSTGYALVDKHADLECVRCHKDERTYLGLQSDCLSCHADEHREQLSTDCVSCHDLAGWKPVPAFAHERSRYSLTGRHQAVTCEACHALETDSAGNAYRRFRPLLFAACDDCHADLHRGQFAPRVCTDCHSVDGFRPANIDHQRSRYPLQGRHLQVKCGSCHPGTKGTDGVGLVTYRPLPFARCAACHVDPHAGQFDEDCAHCHRVDGWKTTPVDHGQTRYPLRGKHQAVACVACHGPDREARYRGLAFAACADCHADAHAGQFAVDCAVCHAVDGWKPSAFDHARARFALTGKHIGIACDRCHPLEKSVDGPLQRRWRGVAFAACADCHADVHAGQFDSDCTACHAVGGWKPSTFDHARARYQLDGAHLKVTCVACHQPFSTDDGATTTRYRPLSADCQACHG